MPRGRRIGVIGTGASCDSTRAAAGSAGAAAARCFSATRRGCCRAATRRSVLVERWALTHVPGCARAWRAAIYAQHELRAPAFTRRPQWLRALEPLALRHLRKHVRAGPLRDALTPHYRMGCKRILIADDYYSGAATCRRCEWRRQPISRHRVARACCSADGRRVELDALVTATGFEAAELKPPCPVIGPQGLHSARAVGARRPKAISARWWRVFRTCSP